MKAETYQVGRRGLSEQMTQLFGGAVALEAPI